MFKVGQLAVSKREGCQIQIRRIEYRNNELMLGIGKKGICLVFAKDYELYKKAKRCN